MGKSLLHLLHSRALADVILVIDGTEFPAHKPILAARSDVFKAMFTHESAEVKRFELKEANANAFKILLQYIYGGQIEEASLDGLEDKVLIEADKVSGILRSILAWQVKTIYGLSTSWAN